MNVASAYPNSALPASTLIAISVVMAVCLALWLILVFRADRSGNHAAASRTHEAHGQFSGTTALDETTAAAQTAEDKETENASHAQPAAGR